MSADNYLAVRRNGDGWTVTMEFASDEFPRALKWDDPFYPTYEHALVAAHARATKETYLEYGVIVLDEPVTDVTGEEG